MIASTQTPVFVVGTGRCGSTLVSHMLSQHPTVLSISELFSFISDFGSRIEEIFPSGRVSGEQFWQILAQKPAKQNLLLKHGLKMEEVIYPFDQTSRYTCQTGVPAILQATLPHISHEPDKLFDKLAAAVLSWSAKSAADQYQALAAWLMIEKRKSLWVERSGGSLRSVQRLVEQFPDARFIHIVRDGRDCATSMSRHYGFRMALIAFQHIEFLGIDPFEQDDRSEADDLPDELAALLPENFSRQAFLDYDIPASLCGYYWAGEIEHGLSVLSALPSERVIHLRYEDFLVQPETSVRQLGEFIDPEGSTVEWQAQASSMVRPNSPRWLELEKNEQQELNDNCQHGFDLLASIGLHWAS